MKNAQTAEAKKVDPSGKPAEPPTVEAEVIPPEKAPLDLDNIKLPFGIKLPTGVKDAFKQFLADKEKTDARIAELEQSLAQYRPIMERLATILSKIPPQIIKQGEQMLNQPNAMKNLGELPPNILSGGQGGGGLGDLISLVKWGASQIGLGGGKPTTRAEKIEALFDAWMQAQTIGTMHSIQHGMRRDLAIEKMLIKQGFLSPEELAETDLMNPKPEAKK